MLQNALKRFLLFDSERIALMLLECSYSNASCYVILQQQYPIPPESGYGANDSYNYVNNAFINKHLLLLKLSFAKHGQISYNLPHVSSHVMLVEIEKLKSCILIFDIWVLNWWNLRAAFWLSLYINAYCIKNPTQMRPKFKRSKWSWIEIEKHLVYTQFINVYIT